MYVLSQAFYNREFRSAYLVKMATEETRAMHSTDSTKTAYTINDANKSQISKALIIQAYCNSVAQQPLVNFGDNAHLGTFQKRINDGLTSAKSHASHYLKVIQPEIIKNMSNIGNYYAIQNSVPITLPEGSTEADWISALSALKDKGIIYQRQARNTADLLNTLHDELTMDVNSFETTVYELNNAVEGDIGALNSINKRLAIVQDEIDAAIAAVVIGAFTIVGGVIMICVGAITEFATAGITTSVVIAGIGILVTGINVETASAIALSNLYENKKYLLISESEIKIEVNLATGIKSGYTSLLKHVKDAVSASLVMENAWKSISADLGTMINGLQNGIMSTGQIRNIFLTEANNNVKIVIEDLSRIKLQMAGIIESVAKNGDTISEAIKSHVEDIHKSKSTMLLKDATPALYLEADYISNTSSATELAADRINTANIAQTSQALHIQAYAISVNEQPMVDFSGAPSLSKYQTEINSALKTAQTHATNYLNVIQPSIITNIANISNYYALHSSVPTTLPEGATEKQWIEVLTAIESQAEAYRIVSNGVVAQLQTLHANLTTDAANFEKIVNHLNAAVNGDNGVLESIHAQLGTIQTQINLAIGGTILSGLAIAGGVFLIAVGGIAEFVTAGTSTLVVVGGIALVCAGIGGETASIVSLHNLNNDIANLLTNEANLTEEVKLAAGISVGYNNLKVLVGTAVEAASGMSNAWQILSADLGSMIDDLKQGINNTAYIRKLFLDATNKVVKAAMQDIQTIKTQMAGVQKIVAGKGETVGDAIEAAVRGEQPKLETDSLLKCTLSMSAVPAGGNLSRSVVSLNEAKEQIRSAINIPNEARRIKAQSLTIISRIAPQVRSVQGSVGEFVKSAIRQLNEIETKLISNETLEKINTAIGRLRCKASMLDTRVTQVLPGMQKAITTTDGYFNQLAQIQSEVTTQRTQLEGKLAYAKSKEITAEKKYYHLIVLGALGLPGLIQASTLYLEIKSEVGGYNGQISDLNSQIFSLNLMNTAAGRLVKDLKTVTTCLSGVKNSVSFVSKDILEIQTDLSLGEARTIIEIAVKAAITLVKTLSIDALGRAISA